MQYLDREQVHLWWHLFKNDNELVEMRAIANKVTYSGYYKNVENLIRDIEFLAQQHQDIQFYYTLNKIDERIYSRQQSECFVKNPKNTTTDAEIIGRRFILIDLDPVRPAGINSSNEELEYAHEKAREVYRFLRDNGLNPSIVCMSSNGWHLNLPVKMAVNDETTKLVKRFLQALSMLFSDEHVEVDEKVFNPSRISKIYGTLGRKGANSAERPWRMSYIADYPQEVKPNDIEYIRKIADMYPEDEVKPNADNHYNVSEKFDLPTFLQKHGLGYRTESVAGGVKYILDHCPFNEQHKGKDAVIFQRDNGAIAFVCLHNGCKTYTWRDVRLKYEPDAYTKKDYAEYEHKRNYYGYRDNRQHSMVQVVKDNEEKGEEWMKLSDVKYVDISSLVHIPTGYTILDKKIMGLLLGDVTVMSGLSGCVDCDTEFFDGHRWKRIADYQEGDRVLQYNADGTAELVCPQEYIKRPCETLHLWKTKYGINQCLSDEHRVVYKTSKGNLAIKRFDELMRQHEASKNGFTGKIYTVFKYGGCGIELSDIEIRIMCAVICDGTFSHHYGDKQKCIVHVKKDRKKERMERLLKESGIEWFRRECSNGYSSFVFHAPRLEKEFSEYWYDCSNDQLKVICDEILHWDGSITPTRRSFSTTSKQTLDFVQFAFTATGERTSIRIDDRVGKTHMTAGKEYVHKSVYYQLIVSTGRTMVSMFNHDTGKYKFQEYKTLDGYKYCFVVPSGMLALRREGRINITGNSGKTSWLDCLALNVVDRGVKTAIWSGELQDFRFQSWIDQIAAGKNYVRKKEGYDNLYYCPKQTAERINSWLDDKLLLYNNRWGNKWGQIYNGIRDAVEKRGCKLIILDNLMALNITDYDGDKYSQQTQFINDIKAYAKLWNIHIILVAHPRKEMGFLRKESISGTADLTNLCDNCFIIHRVNRDFKNRGSEFLGAEKINEYLGFDAVLEVAKNRSMGVVDELIGMYYEKESRRLKNEISENIIYGWMEEGKQAEMPMPQQEERFVPSNPTAGLSPNTSFDDGGFPTDPEDEDVPF